MENNNHTSCYRIQISGKVQGVGFRPFIKNLAQSLKLKGEVLNSNFGVQIDILGNQDKVQIFTDKIRENCPSNSVIIDLQIKEIEYFQYKEFSISKSNNDSAPLLIVSPDQAICPNCKREILDPENRRFRYPFTSCLNCGPRFSIVKGVPYDRLTTTMQGHKICSKCEREYGETNGRREHAQSLSCHQCAIELSLWKNAKLFTSNNDQIFELIQSALKEDKIIMVKGVSGFLLCCNANSSIAIQKLRKRKNRKRKPFAVMYPNLDYVKSNFHLSENESDQITSVKAPIVLLKPKEAVLPQEINFDLDKVGVFLPNSGLLHIILNDFGEPIVATSGNITNESIAFRNEDAIKKFSEIADLVLCHALEINFPQDDSVVQFSPKYQQKIILRRSKGMAPEYINVPNQSIKDILAFGADMKSSFAIQNRGCVHLSPHIGDLAILESQNRHELLSTRLTNMFTHKPEIVLADIMKSYHSSQMALQYGKRNKLGVNLIQHHEAHFAAILEEHKLWNSEKATLGVIWDGTGLGRDQNIWGGEFFIYSKGKMEHIAQLEYKSWILGDKMAKEPRISALSYFQQIENSQFLLKNKFDNKEWELYHKMIASSSIETSSIGRLFDAVASILGLCDYNDFQGQAAMLLEQEASKYEKINMCKAYDVSIKNNKVMLTRLLKGIIKDKIEGVGNAEIAYKFHLSLLGIILEIATRFQTTQIAFSGGVFQNALLVDLIIQEIGSNYDLFFHQQLSPNDENISFGQIMHYNNIKA